MNILNLAPFNVWDLGYGRGRASTYLPLKGLADAGHRVWWLTSAEETAKGDDAKLIQDGINVVRFKVPVPTASRGVQAIVLSKLHASVFVLSCLTKAYELSRQIQPDLLYAHQLIAAFPAFLLSRALRVPYVVKAYGFFPGIFKQRLYWGKLAFKLTADLYVLVNDGTSADRIALSHGVPKEKIAFLVNGIDKQLPQKADLSLKHQLAPAGQKIVLATCRLVAWKRVDLLIKAVSEVTRGDSNVVFVIVGDGPDTQRLVALAKQLGISGFVRFEGAVPGVDIPSYMCAADIFTSLNATSNLGNPLLEAMCCGKPVIALNTGTTSDVITHGVNGILLEEAEIDRLPSEILRLIDDDALRQSLGETARQFILENWPSWDERVAEEVRLIEDVVQRHHQGMSRASSSAAH